MRNLLCFWLLVIWSLPALAVADGQVMYAGGTAPGINAGVVGRLDTTVGTALVFVYAGDKLSIPYDSIQSFEYSKEVTRHLGVMPAIAVGMVKMRRHRHYFRISYRDSNQVEQAVVFEVPKQMPRTLRAVLEARTPCRSNTQCAAEKPVVTTTNPALPQ